MTAFRSLHIVAVAGLFVISADARAAGARAVGPDRPAATVRVAGSGLDHLDTAVVHSKETTPTGLIQKSTEIVELEGDMKGRVPYQGNSGFDFVHGPLLNTGQKGYSRTTAG